MKHPYEYMTLVKYLEPTSAMETIDLSLQPAQDALGRALQKFMGELPLMISKLPDANGWRVNSHSFTFAGNVILVSILLERSRT